MITGEEAAQWVAGVAPVADTSTLTVCDPATDAVVGHVPRMGPDAVCETIEAAVIAQQRWRDTTALER